MYDVKQEMYDRIVNDFGYHKPPTKEAADSLQEIRRKFTDLACFLVGQTPASRDQSIGLTHLEEAQRAFVASIAKTWPIVPD